jgi:hypothetical protein
MKHKAQNSLAWQSVLTNTRGNTILLKSVGWWVIFPGGGRLLAARFVIPEHDDVGYRCTRAVFTVSFAIYWKRKTNIDGKWFYGVQTNYHFSINIILIKALFADNNHGGRINYKKAAHKRINRNGISGFRLDVDQICALLGYDAVQKWSILTDVLGQDNGPVLKGQEIQNWISKTGFLDHWR